MNWKGIPHSITLNLSGITVDQFNKKRVLLPQTLDISYSGVHGNKKFPTVEGPEVVRWGKGLTWLGLGVEASRKFYSTFPGAREN